MEYATREQVEKLKSDWLNDPIWDIDNIVEDAEMYSPYKEELILFQKVHSMDKALISEKMQKSAIHFSIMFLMNSITEIEKTLEIVVETDLKVRLKEAAEGYKKQLSEFEVAQFKLVNKL